MAWVDVAVNTRYRREPPQPLGDTVNYFSVSAATPISLSADPHPSGFSIRVKLDNPHPDRPFRTGELVNGRVHIYAPPGSDLKRLTIPNLSLRVYFESRTLFWSLEQKQSESAVGQKLSKIKDVTAQDYENVMRHEVHRGIVPPGNLTISWDARAGVDVPFESGQAVLPFSFIVPRRMSIGEYNEHEGAPRDLCALERCPPPTMRDSRYGSVQWVVEAIMDLVPNAQGEQDDEMLRLPTQDQVLTRLVFPVMPSVEDVGSLRDEVFFGKDPRVDTFGSRMLSEAEVESGKKVMMERVRARGGKWETYVKEIMMTNRSTVWSELYTPAGARIATDAFNLPLVLFLKHTSTHSNVFKSLFRSPKPKPVYLQRILITLLRTSSTRGGKETKPHTNNVPIRQRELRFDESNDAPSGSKPTPGLLLPSEDSAAPLELDLTFDLQSQIEPNLVSGNMPSIPLKGLTPSFRTPNIQHEYLLAVSVWLVEDEIERFVARFPVQVVPSDENQLPAFEDIVDGQPPTFADSTGLPHYGQS